MEKKSFLLYHENYEQPLSPRHPDFCHDCQHLCEGFKKLPQCRHEQLHFKAGQCKGYQNCLDRFERRNAKAAEVRTQGYFWSLAFLLEWVILHRISCALDDCVI